jgi:hypothetical protein
MAITASFSPGVGAVFIKRGQPSVANIGGIQASGLGGGDTIFLDETNGARPPARPFAEVGCDGLSGGSGSDQPFGRYCGGRHNG